MTTPTPRDIELARQGAAEIQAMLGELAQHHEYHIDQHAASSVHPVLLGHIATARAEGEAAGAAKCKPTMWWIANDTEYSHSDPDEFLEPGEYATGAVLHMTCASCCPDEFYTVVGDLEADEDQSLRPSTAAEIKAYIAKLRPSDNYLRAGAEKALDLARSQGAPDAKPK